MKIENDIEGGKNEIKLEKKVKICPMFEDYYCKGMYIENMGMGRSEKLSIKKSMVGKVRIALRGCLNDGIGLYGGSCIYRD